MVWEKIMSDGSHPYIDEWLDNDEISAEEEGFMRGYAESYTRR